MKKLLTSLFIILLFFACNAKTEEKTEDKELTKLTLALDWVPNTNHTGLFVAKDLGYFEEEGIDFEIVQPAEDSSASIVGAGSANFGISFQPNLVKRIVKGVPVTAVAAIVNNNTAGIMTKGDIKSLKDLNGKSYSTWEDKIDDATVKAAMNAAGGDYSTIKFAPGEPTEESAGIQAGLYDFIISFEAWGYINAKLKNVDVNFFPLKDVLPELNYYTPVLIANDNFLKENPELAKKALRAIKKGYEFAAENPEKAAEILIKNAPEGNHELIKESQKFLSTKYIDGNKYWGYIDPIRWNAFYNWVSENGLVDNKLPENAGFTNDFLGN